MTDTIFEDAKQIFERMSYNFPKDVEDDLDQIPYYKNERFGAWALKQGIDIYLSNEELCKKKYEEYKKLVREQRKFE